MQSIECPKCGRKGSSGRELAPGSAVRCPGCGARFGVGEAAGIEPESGPVPDSRSVFRPAYHDGAAIRGAFAAIALMVALGSGMMILKPIHGGEGVYDWIACEAFNVRMTLLFVGSLTWLAILANPGRR